MPPEEREDHLTGGSETELLYLARTLREALSIEELLTKDGVAYKVVTGEYMSGFLFRRELTGAYFYVTPESAARARDLLVQSRYKPFASEEQDPPQA